MIEALIRGERNPEVLAEMARGKMRPQDRRSSRGPRGSLRTPPCTHDSTTSRSHRLPQRSDRSTRRHHRRGNRPLSVKRYLAAQFRRFRRRFGKRGDTKAVFAVADTMLVIVWHILAKQRRVQRTRRELPQHPQRRRTTRTPTRRRTPTPRTRRHHPTRRLSPTPAATQSGLRPEPLPRAHTARQPNPFRFRSITTLAGARSHTPLATSSSVKVERP